MWIILSVTSAMERWSGKVALVTGASAGIGEAIAEQLAKHGIKVVGLARRVEKVEQLKAKVGKVKGEIIPVKGDVSKLDDIEAVFDFIEKRFGTIHILVNNAGVLRQGMIIDASLQSFQDIININVMGLTICTQKALQLMKKTGVNDGHIIHINSIAGHFVPKMDVPNLNIYPASKHAVTAITETLRQELTHLKMKTKVTSISPGYVATEITEAAAAATGQQWNEEFQKMIADLPALESIDIADSVVYVLSTPPRVQVQELTIRPLGERY